jgi:molybdenum cofactor guanylyltransferase
VRIAGVILAGGLGRRMGGADKALVSLSGMSLIGHVLNRLAPQVQAVAINANGDPARFAAFGVPVVADTLPDFPGPLAGLLAGMVWAKGSGFDAVAVVAVDTPFFPADMVAQLQAGIGSGDVALAESDGQLHPTCGLWRVGLQSALAAALAAGQRRVAGFAAEQALIRVPFATGASDPFFNINSAEDLALAETLIRGRG